MNWLKRVAFAKKEEGKPAVAANTPPTELELLKDIRDLLAERRNESAPAKHASPPRT
jgi:large conductance mechanosensitive channel